MKGKQERAEEEDRQRYDFKSSLDLAWSPAEIWNMNGTTELSLLWDSPSVKPEWNGLAFVNLYLLLNCVGLPSWLILITQIITGQRDSLTGVKIGGYQLGS